jgi:16S rRNA (guanine1207-N2)-methyltransferase
VAGHYFEDRPAAASRPEKLDVLLPDVAFSLTTDRGVFSHGGLDTGTRLLLNEQHDLPPSGDLLDLGCGAGPIAITMALRAPGATVWAIDVNERARGLTRDNADRAGATNVEVRHPDDVPDSIVFGAIWSNPPIRIGKAALHTLLATWLGRLDASGHALLVVSRHLGADSLAAWLGSQGWTAERLRSRAGYRLLRVGREPAQAVQV